MTDLLTPQFVGVDWGTSSFRLWVMSVDGAILAERRSAEGMSATDATAFKGVLDQHLSALKIPEDIPVLICGMAGSKQGWVDAGYTNIPTLLVEVSQSAVTVPSSTRDVRILPGIANADPRQPNVMRGEETQLIGAIPTDFTGFVCQPGTHSKWVRFENGRLTNFLTFMTGELYSVLTKHSILRHSMAGEKTTGFSLEAFENALNSSKKNPMCFMSSLFQIRSSDLLQTHPKQDGSEQLSGLLIGTELAEIAQRFPNLSRVVLIASGLQAKLYQAGLRQFGLEVDNVDADEAVKKGLLIAARRIWNF
ncbi:2-dehydro-3-deoxygalactonokinase [Brucella gallinifaecis]|uniref:2-dehydro-3-deoxygalactonokinase n=1 Tax=Brucella gallinifaecis TaxID=215590 RepID=A0A502BJZ1_9HYPH|nr:2-dehydro-3-deoxygalactonokinase [Brucella gallinifaecis]TPF74147.1 2-dehydro-3-deoxygalactonokinase [Brucella gallinifaecis]